tara:strand:+ start:856 stop:1062 length:207 start_codon:yes stop_codon:yes gene_type:complete
MKEFLMVISMWGYNGTAWEYIGNQWIDNTPMTQEVCEEKIKRKNWSIVQKNGFYALQFDCFHKSQEVK